MSVDETHDPELRSWVESANRPHTNFPIQNLPFGVFRMAGGLPRIGVAIGDAILDLAGCSRAGLIEAAPACESAQLNGLMSLGPVAWRALRHTLSRLLHADSPQRQRVEPHLVPASHADMVLPARIGDFTDFYASVFHAINVGKMFRPDNPLLPNYKYVPIAYHGRSSSIMVSGTPVLRPCGQTHDGTSGPPSFGPSRRLDYELEVGVFVGPGNPPRRPIPIQEAGDCVFGVCLVNDWSARDIQRWEYQPLGPFLSKSFATSISPWIVTADALAPFRVPAFARPEGDPAPLPYLYSEDDAAEGGIDLHLEALLSSEQMRKQGCAPVRLSRGNFRNMYWTIAQMLAHHASNGCNLRPGDLLASGTVSGPTEDSLGCLLELAAREPVRLPTGEVRRALEDGDEVILRGYCEREGFARIGLGECRGVVLPS
ncbi:MAG: fumarylacetoacetase [Bryobacteraceae bacterium]